ncbi:hypothetical protein EI94DRAFT_1801569 [Lactarius quietus]|nr:hypothetical protein EI94DRAFT_1801569 [Lactarius quietus]
MDVDSRVSTIGVMPPQETSRMSMPRKLLPLYLPIPTTSILSMRQPKSDDVYEGFMVCELKADERRLAILRSRSGNTSQVERVDVTRDKVPGTQPSVDQAGSVNYDSGIPGVAPQGAPSGTSSSGSRDGGNETTTDANINHGTTDTLLNHLLDHARTSEHTTTQLASHINELSKAVAALLESGVSHANQPTQAQPAPVTPNFTPCRARRHGPPGEPQEAVTPPLIGRLKSRSFM